MSRGLRGSLGKDARDYIAVFFSTTIGTGIAECLAENVDFYIAAAKQDVWLNSTSSKAYQEFEDCRLWMTSPEQVKQQLPALAAGHNKAQLLAKLKFAKLFAWTSRDFLQRYRALIRLATKVASQSEPRREAHLKTDGTDRYLG